jgi:2-dehydro-3-deoxygluconokinase
MLPANSLVTTMTPASFASIGECMIELSAGDGDSWRMGFAGDTFNTAWYVRAILPRERRVAYVTALGEDPFSERMRAFMAEAGVETGRIRSVPGKRPGLYAITLNEGERQFTYWRGESAARELADDPGWLRSALAGADMLYFSGITLAILKPDRREQLLLALSERRDKGARIAFDPNFRPVLWPHRDEARQAMEAAYSVADVVLPTLSDEKELFGDRMAEATVERVSQLGAQEIVVKNGADPCLVAAGARRYVIRPVAPEKIIDTTGAGDSFCGAYLAGRLMGMAPEHAARLGHVVAARVVTVHGALAKIDRADVLAAAE